MCGGKSILVGFDYDKKTDIAVPKRVVGSINEQALGLDIDLDLDPRGQIKRLEEQPLRFPLIAT